MTSINDEEQIKSEVAMQAIFEQASRRLQPPIAAEEEIRSAVHAEWLQMNARRGRGKQAVYWAMAASLVLVAFLSLNRTQTPEIYTPVAMIEKSIGEIALRQNDSGSTIILGNLVRSISSGQTITTGMDSALALAWSAGGSLRMGEETELVFVSPTEVELLAGQIYFDSGMTNAAHPDVSLLRVNTHAGIIQHIGTQFMTKLVDDSLTVSVREGVVSIDAKNYVGTAMAGQQVTLRVNGSVSKEARPGYGAEWQWVQSIAPPLDLDGLSVLNLLNWVSRESGRSLKFESVSAETIAIAHVLNGRVEVEPMRALRIYLQTTDLESELVDDVISIRLATAGE